MANNERKRPSREMGKKIRWHVLRSIYARDQEEYRDSLLCAWEARIKDGHDAEEKRIEELSEKFRKQHLPDDYPEDIWSDEYHMTHDLTNDMYAALIVAIWSKMESFLKHLVRACYREREEQGKVPPKELQDMPWQMKDIKKEIRNLAGIEIGDHRCYPTVNAIRILNNSFKHRGGRYRPNARKDYEKIEESLLEKWMIEEKQNIDYSKISIEELFSACNAFSKDVLDEVASAVREPQATNNRDGVGVSGKDEVES